MKRRIELCRRLLCGISALIICVVFLGGCEETEKYPSPTEKFFINDFSDVVSENDADKIYKKGVELQEKTGAQLVAVTLDSTSGEEISEYATELGRKWGLGEKDKDNGVLILLAAEDRNIFIAVGRGLEGALPDSKTGRLLDIYAIPYLSKDDFSAGITEVYSAVANEIYLEYGMEPDENYVSINEVEAIPEEQTSPWVVIVSWIIMLVVIAGLSAFARKRGIHVFFFPGGFGGGGFGGGFGGGSFGGGGFSGGGGSFGGGGAGRSF